MICGRPTVAIIQWRNEIETHTDGMKVLVWHGHSRETDVQEVEKYDVVRVRVTFVSALMNESYPFHTGLDDLRRA